MVRWMPALAILALAPTVPFARWQFSAMGASWLAVSSPASRTLRKIVLPGLIPTVRSTPVLIPELEQMTRFMPLPSNLITVFCSVAPLPAAAMLLVPGSRASTRMAPWIPPSTLAPGATILSLRLPFSPMMQLSWEAALPPTTTRAQLAWRASMGAPSAVRAPLSLPPQSTALMRPLRTPPSPCGGAAAPARRLTGPMFMLRWRRPTVLRPTER